MFDVSEVLKYEGYTQKLVGPQGEEEEWRPVLTFEGFYEVSNFGRVKSLRRVVRTRPGRTRIVRSRILKQRKDKKGRMVVGLHREGFLKTRTVHTIELESFKGERPIGMEACHFDGDNSNNFLSNLRWDTHLNNEKDKVRHGTVNMGSKHPMSKLKEGEVLLIRKILNAKIVTQTFIAKMFKVTKHAIYRIKTGKSWGWLNG